MSMDGFIWDKSGGLTPRKGVTHYAVPDLSVEVNEGWLLFTCRTCGAEALVIKREAERSTAHLISHAHGKELQVLFQDSRRN